MTGRSVRAFGIAFAGYLALSVVLWWHVWSSHPTTVTTCGCDDPSLFIWFLEWPAYALAHGHNPFFSTSIFPPVGINLLSNTSVLAIGIPLAPVTWLFGPVATLNVASTLGPALTALAMFWLLRRWVQWTPAAFVGGLVFGFSPFVFENLAVDHLMTSVLVLVPLMVGCLDELLVRQRRRPLVSGTALGLLVVGQFFLSTEILSMVVICGVGAVVVLVAYGLAGHRQALVERIRRAVGGLGVAAAVALVLLGYPLWFALEGRAHLSGLVWPSLVPGAGGIDLSNLWHLRFQSASAVHLFAGYQGPALPQGEYLGLGLLVVVVVGLTVWRRDTRLWFFAVLGAMAVWLSLGVQNHYWVPWRVLARIPVIQNVTVNRFMAITTLCAAVMVGIVVDRTRASVVAWVGSRVAGSGAHHRAGTTASWVAAVAWGTALGVGAVAVVPIATAVAGNVPFTTETLVSPAWFTDVAPHLPSDAVVLTDPPAVAGASAMSWQAVDALQFTLATGTGPESIPQRAGPERRGLGVITSDALVLSPPEPATSGNVAAVRQALSGWNVSIVVVPDPTVLVPYYDRTARTAMALALFTAALGRPPQFRHDAWVWDDVRSPGRRLPVPAAAMARCATAPLLRDGSRQVVPDCVLAAARRA